jgi:hypothetical protein
MEGGGVSCRHAARNFRNAKREGGTSKTQILIATFARSPD